ncbi:MAG: P1 family peptidase [Pararhizobium sp.]
MMKRGPRNLITDVAGLKVGHAEDRRLKSGSTVLVGDEPFLASYAVMGGAPGTRDTDLLEADKTVEAIDALVLSGGSAFGLDAASGVMDALRAAGRGFAVGPVRVPIVPAAIIFDLANGGTKDWVENPYRALGHRAYEAAAEDFAIGSVGAGTGALTGTLKGGLGSASLVLPSGVTVAALAVANAIGSVTVPDRPHFWAAPFEADSEFGGLGPCPDAFPLAVPVSRKREARAAQGNTTIAIVATDASLTKAQCKRLAVSAHDGLARAIVPAHTPFDGDLVFALSTGRQPLTDPAEEGVLLGHAASLALARAIARAVHAATPEPGDVLPTWSQAFTASSA